MMLDERVRYDLMSTYDRLIRDDQITPPAKLPALYAIFQQRFGPQVLASLDGEALLSTLKPSSTKDNLAYWLEFKNDEEFPAICER